MEFSFSPPKSKYERRKKCFDRCPEFDRRGDDVQWSKLTAQKRRLLKIIIIIFLRGYPFWTSNSSNCSSTKRFFHERPPKNVYLVQFNGEKFLLFLRVELTFMSGKFYRTCNCYYDWQGKSRLEQILLLNRRHYTGHDNHTLSACLPVLFI